MEPINRTDLRARVRVRKRQTRLLLPALVHAVRWQPIALTGAVAAAVILLMQRSESYDPFLAARVAAIALCAGSAFLLDDPAASTIANSPAPLSFRRGLRIGLGIAVLAATWGGLVALAARTPRALYGGEIAPGMPFPTGRLSLELCALLATMLAGTVIAGRVMDEHSGGVAGGPVLVLSLAIVNELPSRWTMLVGPGNPAWSAAGERWTGLLVIAAITLAVLSRDPGGARLRRKLIPAG